MRFGSTIATLLFTLTACSGRDATGTYLGGDESAQVMLQITSVDNGDVKGTLTAAIADGNGRVKAVNRTVSGTVSDQLLNLTVDNWSDLSLLTGKLNGDTFEITGFGSGRTTTLRLQRTNASEFAERVAAMRRDAAETKATIDDDRRQAKLDDRLVDDQTRIDEFAKETLVKASIMADRTISALQVASGYDRNEAKEAWIRMAAQREHDTVSDLLETLDRSSLERKRDAGVHRASCVAVPDLDCSGINAAMVKYAQREAALRGAIARERSAYRLFEQAIPRES